MKSKMIPMIISTSLIYIIFIFWGFSFLDDFLEHIIISTVIFFTVLCINFYCMNCKEKFLSKFIVEKKLTFLFILLALINLILFLVYFFRTDGLHRIMYCTILSSYINVCVCNFIYLKGMENYI